MRSEQGQTDEKGVCLLFIEPLLIFGRVCIRGERVEHEERQHVDPGPNGQGVQQLQGPNLIALDAQRHDGAGTSSSTQIVVALVRLPPGAASVLMSRDVAVARNDCHRAQYQ